MSMKWTIFALTVLTVFSVSSFAAKPVREPATTAPEVFSVKVDYVNGFIIVDGTNLDPASASATIAGVNLTVDGSSTDTALLFPFSVDVSAVVDELGTYVLIVTTDGGSFSVSTFIPFALATAPPPPPPGPDCPCSTEWDEKSTTASPNGFAGLTPYCGEDYGDFITVQFYDIPESNYWVLWTSWNAAESTGFCELYIDGPYRPLTTQVQFDACAGYLNNIITVWGNQNNTCFY